MEQETEKMRTKLEELFEVESRFGIVMAIRLYGSLNIKKLASILGKTESTIHSHLQAMLEPPAVLEIDPEKTQSLRGKYFKLAAVTAAVYSDDQEDVVFDETLPALLDRWLALPESELKEILMERIRRSPDPGKLAAATRRKLRFYHNLETIIINSVEQLEQKIMRGEELEEGDSGHLTSLAIEMPITSLKHELRIGVIVNDFIRAWNQLKREITQEIEQTQSENDKQLTVHYHLFGGTINAITKQ